jgi:hypothetical protein
MPTTTKVTKGNTLLPLNTVISIGADPVDLSLYTVKFRMVEQDDTTSVVVDDLTTGITVHPTQTFTAAVNDRLTCNGHGVTESNQIVVSSTNTLPTGLAASTRYFPVEITPNAFKLAEYPGGPAIDITGAGSGTHSFYVVGSVQRDWQSTDVDEAGNFLAWFKLFTGSEFQHVPYDGASWLVIVEQSY